MKLSNEVLKKIILASGFVSDEDFEAAAKTSSEVGKDIIDLLIFRGLLNEEVVGKMMADYYQAPFISLKTQTFTPEILSIIPEKMSRMYKIIPFGKEDGKLKLAMEDPEDFEALEFAKRHTGLIPEVYYVTKEDMGKSLGQYKKGIKEDFGKVIGENLKKLVGGKDEDLAKSAEQVPVVKILSTLLSYAISERASDIHIETMEDEVIIRYRIDGMLKDIIKFPRGVENSLVARIKILSNLKVDEHRIPQDGRYKFESEDNETISLRISIIPSFYGENVVMRLLREANRPSSLEELGFTGHNLEILRENISKPHGMILVTGPTGSGKTTTLYSVLNILNTIDVKVCTIEDPIEYGMHRVTQIQVNSKTGLEFSAGLRALLRHDPNIIMVGEIRDQETAKIAINSALTGHLVLSTLHTNTAAGAIPRFLDMGAEDFLLASTINVIIAQRLVRKICSACITNSPLNEDIVKKLSKDLNVDLKNQKFYKGKGCAQCGNKGYMGRVGIYEALSITEKIRDLITKRSTSDEIQRAAMSEGMTTMLQDGLDKVSSGLTTIEEIVRVAREN